MKEENRTPEQDAFQESFYQTGSTRPPKSYRGLVAVLLVLVIFLGGIVSALGLMNIHLFRALQNQTPAAASFRFSQEQTLPASADAAHWPALGLSGHSIPAVHQHYYGLPQGLCITGVNTDSDAAGKGVQNGDILTQINGVSVADAAALEALLANYQPGETVSVVFYRNGSTWTLSLILE